MKEEIIRIDLSGVNCYLVKAGDGFVLCDTGGHMVMDKEFTNRREQLERELEKVGCQPGKLKLIVLTHGDCDHVANAAYIREKYKVKIAMHSDDLRLVENPTIDVFMESFRYKSFIFKIVFKLMKKTIKKVTLKTLEHFEKFTPDILLNEDFDLSEYGLNAKVLHVPGHTAGSVCVLTSEGNLIAGDTFSNMNKPDTAPNAYDFKTLTAGVSRLKDMDIRTIYPGHGIPFEAGLLLK